MLGYFIVPMINGYIDIDISKDIAFAIFRTENTKAYVYLEYSEKKETWEEITKAEFDVMTASVQAQQPTEPPMPNLQPVTNEEIFKAVLMVLDNQME